MVVQPPILGQVFHRDAGLHMPSAVKEPAQVRNPSTSSQETDVAIVGAVEAHLAGCDDCRRDDDQRHRRRDTLWRGRGILGRGASCQRCSRHQAVWKETIVQPETHG